MLRILASATPAPSSLSIASSEERPKKKTLSISDPLYLRPSLSQTLSISACSSSRFSMRLEFVSKR